MKTISATEAVSLWNDVSIFAKNTEGVDWQINHDQEFRSAYIVLDECLQDGCTFFTD